MTFKEWLSAIDVLADAEGGRGKDGRSYTQATGTDCWREAFDDGLSPADAWHEEKLAGVA